MIRITADEFKTVPWKNGKGITQQIISSSDTDDYDWRFSRAAVSSDGPFSIFEGKSRILTVIEGNGLSLISNSNSIEAKLFDPVCFDGNIEINGKLWDGPIKDLNLIYSSKRINTKAQFIQGNKTLNLKPDNTLFFALYCLKGNVNHDLSMPLIPGDFAVITDAPCSISLDEQNQLLLYELEHTD